jgi:hypothetical protein
MVIGSTMTLERSTQTDKELNKSQQEEEVYKFTFSDPIQDSVIQDQIQ